MATMAAQDDGCSRRWLLKTMAAQLAMDLLTLGMGCRGRDVG